MKDKIKEIAHGGWQDSENWIRWSGYYINPKHKRDFFILMGIAITIAIAIVALALISHPNANN